jgi:superfamily II DNA or RNA helicase
MPVESASADVRRTSGGCDACAAWERAGGVRRAVRGDERMSERHSAPPETAVWVPASARLPYLSPIDHEATLDAVFPDLTEAQRRRYLDIKNWDRVRRCAARVWVDRDDDCRYMVDGLSGMYEHVVHCGFGEVACSCSEKQICDHVLAVRLVRWLDREGLRYPVTWDALLNRMERAGSMSARRARNWPRPDKHAKPTKLADMGADSHVERLVAVGTDGEAQAVLAVPRDGCWPGTEDTAAWHHLWHYDGSSRAVGELDRTFPDGAPLLRDALGLEPTQLAGWLVLPGSDMQRLALSFGSLTVASSTPDGVRAVPVPVVPRPWVPTVEYFEDEQGYGYFRLRRPDLVLPDARLVVEGGVAMPMSRDFHPALLSELGADIGPLAPELSDRLMHGFLSMPNVRVRASGEGLVGIAPAPRVDFYPHPRGAVLDLSFLYSSVVVHHGQGPVQFRARGDDGELRLYASDPEAEAGLEDAFFELFEASQGWRPLQLPALLDPEQARAVIDFLLDGLPPGWRLHGALSDVRPIEAALRSSGIDFFGLSAMDTLDVRQIASAMREGGKHVLTDDGRVYTVTREMLKHLDAVEALGEAEDDEGLLLNPDVERLALHLWPDRAEQLRRARAIIEAFERLPLVEAPPVPAGCQLKLWDHQVKTYETIMRRAVVGLGTLLASDVGVGKTLPTLLAALAWLRADGGQVLWVTTRSLADGFEQQLRKAIDEPVRVHRVGEPVGQCAIEDADIVLATYGMLRSRAERLTAPEWTAVVLDESSEIKNCTTAAHRVARRLRTERRVLLNATPIENGVEDLWAQLQFLTDGALMSEAAFAGHYSGGDEGDSGQHEDRLAQLAELFQIRDRQEDVLDLPELSMRTVRVPPTAEQERLQKLLTESVLELGREGQIKVMHWKIQQLLISLRMLACETRHVESKVEVRSHDAPKIDCATDLVLEWAEQGHRTLVFSEWNLTLDTLEARLRARGIIPARLDGNTRARGRVVAGFQQPDGAPVMLVNVKAGGAGLTLTAAERVILLEPQWQPARTRQAVGRAHRAGQTRPVEWVQLIAAGTVDEKVWELQGRKKVLADRIIDGVRDGVKVASIEALIFGGRRTSDGEENVDE